MRWADAVPNFQLAGSFRAGDVGEFVGLPALGIEQNLIPTDHRHLVGGGRTGGEAALEGCGRKEIEFSVYFSLAGGNFDVDGEAVEQIAAPLQGFAAGEKLESGQIDRPGRRARARRESTSDNRASGLRRWRESSAWRGKFCAEPRWHPQRWLRLAAVADQTKSGKKRMKKGRQTTPRILESFIVGAPMCRQRVAQLVDERIPQRLQNFRL